MENLLHLKENNLWANNYLGSADAKLIIGNNIRQLNLRHFYFITCNKNEKQNIKHKSRTGYLSISSYLSVRNILITNH